MFKTLTARFPGTCKRCGEGFPAGTRIRYGGRGRTYHFAAECPASGETPGTSSDTGTYRSGYRVFSDGSYREDFRSDDVAF